MLNTLLTLTLSETPFTRFVKMLKFVLLLSVLVVLNTGVPIRQDKQAEGKSTISYSELVQFFRP